VPQIDRRSSTATLGRRGVLAAALSALAVACTTRIAPDRSSPAAAPTPPLAAHPDSGHWPELVLRSSLEVREAYAWAVKNEETLRFIPCYCGCGLSVGHRDNFDCYVSEVRVGGWLVLDTHSLG
jgi:hypothetical protein